MQSKDTMDVEEKREIGMHINETGSNFWDGEKWCFEPEARTVEDFVEDCISDGRTPQQVIIIANQTHWKGKITEIEEYLGKIMKNLKKINKNGKKNR